MQCVREKYAAKLARDNCTVQQFMGQVDVVGFAHDVVECFAMLNALV